MPSEDDPRVAELHEDLRARLGEPAREWLRSALADAATRDTSPLPAWERHFAAAGRRCGGSAGGAGQPQGQPQGPGGRPGEPPVRARQAPGVGPETVGAGPGEAATGDAGPGGPASAETAPDPAEPPDPPDPADAARVLLLHSARPNTPTLTRLYTQGTAAERRAVLLSLEVLDPGPEALALIEDALRTNDTRLVATALRGSYAARHLPPHAWRQAVLKCLFTGVPVAVVAGLARRAAGDTELARMLADYAVERTAAGRRVPDDLTRVLALTAKEQS